MEIERKYLVSEVPANLKDYHCRVIEQGYLSTHPVVRVRKDNDSYYLTYKGSGMMAREEYNLPLTAESYEHLLAKADRNIITKKRYEIPDGTGKTIELVYLSVFSGLTLARKIDLKPIEEANAYIPPSWLRGCHHGRGLSQQQYE